MSNEGRIALLKARLAEREGKPGYSRNVVALKAEIAKLTAPDNPTPVSEKMVGTDPA